VRGEGGVGHGLVGVGVGVGMVVIVGGFRLGTKGDVGVYCYEDEEHDEDSLPQCTN